MSPHDDDQDVQRFSDDRLLAGEPVSGEPELVAFVADLRAMARVPAPAPRADLAALLRDGLPRTQVQEAVAGQDAVVVPLAGRARRGLRYAAGLGLAAKLTLGAGVAAASVTGAATIDAVPDVLQRPAGALVDGVVDLVTRGDRQGEGPEAPVQDPGPEVPATEVPEDQPTSTPTPTDRPGEPGDEDGSESGLERDLPDEADDAAREAREEARQRAEDARERAEERRQDGSEDRGTPTDRPTQTPRAPQGDPGGAGDGQGNGGKGSGAGDTKGSGS